MFFRGSSSSNQENQAATALFSSLAKGLEPFRESYQEKIKEGLILCELSLVFLTLSIQILL